MNNNTEEELNYLAIKNWKKYQAGMDRKGRLIRARVKDYAGKDIDDPEYSKLTMNQRYLLDACIRLRARTGRNLSADPTWVALAIGVIPKERPVLPRNIRTLVERGFLVPTNQKFDASETETQSQTETETETQQGSARSARFGAVSPLPPVEQVKTSGPLGSLANQDRKQPQHRKPCGCCDGLCDWSDPIPGCSNPAHVGDCIYYQRHVKKNDYFIKRLTKGYVLNEWLRLENDTPEDWVYDPDPLFETVEKYFDGMDNPPNKITRPLRKPRTEEERTKFRRVVKNPDMLKDYLTDPNCPVCYGKGLVSYFYDPANPRLEASHPCSCWTEESLPEEVLENKVKPRTRKPAVVVEEE